MKRKRCKSEECKKLFEPHKPMQVVCCPLCAVIYARTNQARKALSKARKAETKELRDKLKTKSDYAKEAQKAVNQYVRLRDKGKPCISCDKPDSGNHQRHASHYRSVGSARQLRFNLWNIHASCKQCNWDKSGNIGEYRPRLIEKIGIEKVEWLECNNELSDYSIEYLKRLKKVFNKKIKRIKK